MLIPRFFRQLGVLAVLLSLLSGLLVGSASAADKKPNILFIAVDDLNDWVGVLGGHPQTKTPNIDRLAARGTLFTQAYCAAPACNPSRTALMTGIRPSTSGVYHNPMPWRPVLPDAVTLTQHFMQHGYTAVGGGKIFHGAYNDDASWQEYFNRGADPKPAPQVAKDPHSRAGGIVWGRLDAGDKDMADYRVVDWAIEQLNKPHDKPFFIAAGMFRPHMPWQVPGKYYDMFPVDDIILPEVPEGDLLDIPSAGVKIARPEGDHATILKTHNWKYAVQAYLASIAFVDGQIGRLLDGLDKSGHADDTIIAFWTDHGWHLGEKEHWRKFALWEEATRTPVVFVVPGLTKAGTRCDRPVNLIDIYPTLIDLCGVGTRQELEGVSLRPLLKDPSAEWDRPSLTTHGRNNHALRTQDFRYIRYADGSEELYDHRTDPNEWKNISDDPKLEGMKRELAKWFPKVNAPDAPIEKDKDKKKKGDDE